MIEAAVRLEWVLRARRDQFRPLLTCYFVCLVLDCCALYTRVVVGNDGIFLPPSPGRSGRFLAAAVDFLWFQQWLFYFLLARGSFWTLLCWLVNREYLTKAEKWIDGFERTPCPEKPENAENAPINSCNKLGRPAGSLM